MYSPECVGQTVEVFEVSEDRLWDSRVSLVESIESVYTVPVLAATH